MAVKLKPFSIHGRGLFFFLSVNTGKEPQLAGKQKKDTGVLKPTEDGFMFGFQRFPRTCKLR